MTQTRTEHIICRPATTADGPSIGAIAEAVGMFPADMLQAMITPWLSGSPRDHWLVAVEGEEVIGFAFCEAERLTQGTWNLLAIGVRKDRQGLRIGTQLIDSLESHLRQGGNRVLVVETSAAPIFARNPSFYHANGFIDAGRIPDFYEPGEDKLIFFKRL